MKELSSEGLQRGGSTPLQGPGSPQAPCPGDWLQGCFSIMSWEGTLLMLTSGWQPRCVWVKAPGHSGGAGSRRALLPCGEGSTEDGRGSRGLDREQPSVAGVAVARSSSIRNRVHLCQ